MLGWCGTHIIQSIEPYDDSSACIAPCVNATINKYSRENGDGRRAYPSGYQIDFEIRDRTLRTILRKMGKGNCGNVISKSIFTFFEISCPATVERRLCRLEKPYSVEWKSHNTQVILWVHVISLCCKQICFLGRGANARNQNTWNVNRHVNRK